MSLTTHQIPRRSPEERKCIEIISWGEGCGFRSGTPMAYSGQGSCCLERRCVPWLVGSGYLIWVYKELTVYVV